MATPLSAFLQSVAHTSHSKHMSAERQAGNIAQVRTLETTLQGIQAVQKLERKEQSCNIMVSVALMGKLALAAVPGELYNRLGAAIKQTTEHFVLLLGYTNGYAGYIPSREAYTELDYEVLMCQRSISLLSWVRHDREQKQGRTL
jgi:neutral ceramidase